MPSKFSTLSNLYQRIIAAIVGVSIILSAMFFSVYTFGIIFLIIAILTQFEFYKLLGLDGNLPLSIYGTFCGFVLFVLTFMIERGAWPFKFYYLIVPLLTITFFIKLFKKHDQKPFVNLGYTFLGIIYVAVPFSLILELCVQSNVYFPKLMLGILLILWVNDSGAYFAGTLMGKRKLFERISPKKTWEGFFGGAICSIVVSFFYADVYPSLPVWMWLCIAVIIVITGTLGDLVESLFKRSIAIKDSGSMIPGHGGFLDRFDGLLLSLPFILTFIKIFA